MEAVFTTPKISPINSDHIKLNFLRTILKRRPSCAKGNSAAHDR